MHREKFFQSLRSQIHQSEAGRRGGQAAKSGIKKELAMLGIEAFIFMATWSICLIG
jgi:hypothetical protein